MKAADREMLWDVLAGSAAVLAFVGFIEIGKLYHGYYGLTLEDLLPLAYLLVSWLLWACMRWAGWNALASWLRGWMWLSLLVALAVRYGAIAVQVWGRGAALAGALVVLAFGLWACRKASNSLWAGLRRLVAVLPSLIVATPLVVGHWLDEYVVWLGADATQPKTATVVLLFDEMNAQASEGMQKILRDHGLQVNFKAIKPVHGSTTEVIPAIFTGHDFEGARACGLTRVCTDAAALDFSQVSVQRNDVDVVGFHHPYCSITGLRYCYRGSTARNIFDFDVAICGLKKLLNDNSKVDNYCHKVWHESWFHMLRKIENRIFATPSISKGGVLYVHIPLPHPPAETAGSLGNQYYKNIDSSERIVKNLLISLDSNRVSPRILIFSDHPLRQVMWCTFASKQFDAPCVADPALVDDQVPLIVAARSGLPSIEKVTSNQQVFDVLREWLSH